MGTDKRVTDFMSEQQSKPVVRLLSFFVSLSLSLSLFFFCETITRALISAGNAMDGNNNSKGLPKAAPLQPRFSTSVPSLNVHDSQGCPSLQLRSVKSEAYLTYAFFVYGFINVPQSPGKIVNFHRTETDMILEIIFSSRKAVSLVALVLNPVWKRRTFCSILTRVWNLLL